MKFVRLSCLAFPLITILLTSMTFLASPIARAQTSSEGSRASAIGSTASLFGYRSAASQHLTVPTIQGQLVETLPASNRLIIKLNPTGNDETIGELKSEIDATLVLELDSIGAEVWEISGNVTDTVVAYQNDPRIAFIESDAIITVDPPEAVLLDLGDMSHQSSVAQNSAANDTYFSYQWALHNTGQDGGAIDADIDGLEAWGILTGTNVVVGVIDSGVDYTHADLAQNMWVNPGEIAGNNIDDDGNGFVDDVHGWDFFDDDNEPSDTNGHGTHVAGTIAAVSNNSSGVAGVSWNAKIMALRFIGPDGWGYLSDAIAAIEYATLMDAKLTNNSWGGGGYYQAMYDAIDSANQAGILFVAAAGNETNNNDLSPSYPASYELDNVISVASTTRDDELSTFSNYGLTSVHLGAPGSTILSTYLDGGYAFLNGTSMASPHVAGAAALLWSAFPGAEASQIKARLLDSVDPIAALEGQVATGGRLNLHKALTHQYAAPSIELSSSELSLDLTIGEALSTTISLTNSGNVTLEWGSTISYTMGGTLSDSGTDWLTMIPTSGLILSGTSAALNLMINATDLISGVHEAELTIISNDPDTPSATIRIVVSVAAPSYPMLRIPSTLEATYWPDAIHPDPTISLVYLNRISVPIEFVSNDLEIGSTIFSWDIDETCLGFDDTDENEDGIPDRITVELTDTFSASILYDPTDIDGELDFLFADLSSPISPFPDGILATVDFDILCEPELAESNVAPIFFGTDPAPSFGDIGGLSIPGTAINGAISVWLGLWSGDCNGDSMIGAADISAVIWEIFDGDGGDWLSASEGSFVGNEDGCDANTDEQIDAGDLICTVLILFDGPGACHTVTSPSGNNDESNGTIREDTILAIGEPSVDDNNRTVQIPIRLEQSSGMAGAISLSISYDPAIFSFDPTDEDGDGLPDTLSVALGGDHTVSVAHNANAHQVEIVIADLMPQLGLQPPLTALPDGDLLLLAFQLNPDIERGTASVADAVARYFAKPSPPIDFGTAVQPSVGNLDGQSSPLRTINRAATAQTQTAILPPTTNLPDQASPSDDGEVQDEGDGADELTEPADPMSNAGRIRLFMPLIGQ